MKKKCLLPGINLKIFCASKTFLIMRLTVFILLFSVIQVWGGNSYSQITKISLNLKDVTVQKVLNEIENQSEFYFLYSGKLVDVDRKIDINVKNERIKDILTGLFADKDINCLVMDRQILLSPKNITERVNVTLDRQPQEIVVTGKVTDEDGNPLPGVNIIITGTLTGTITNVDGNYSIEVDDPDATLEFSFIGYGTQKVDIAGRAVINITLAQEVIGLDEVVAIGYGVAKKSDLTGSVASADIERFREQPNTNLLQSLQGSIAGLNVGITTSAGRDPVLFIRGENTFKSGGNDPLIVLDGIIYNGAMVDINPNDIESVDVLKDASSASIYGSRASNGVIILTTKQGIDKGKPIISYSGYYSMQAPAKELTPLDREGYLQKLKNMYWKEAYLAPNYTEPNPDFDYLDYMVKNEIKDGYNAGIETEWLDIMSQDSYIQNHNLSIREKSERTAYFISGIYSDQKGYVINDTYKKRGLRINFDTDVTNWLNVGVQSFMNLGDYSGITPSYSWAIMLPPVVSPYDENGEIKKMPVSPVYNPLLNTFKDDSDKRFNLFGNLYAQIEIPWVKGLSYRLNYSNNYRTTSQSRFDEWGESEQGAAYKNNSLNSDWTFDNIITFTRTLSQKHLINATLVYGAEKREGNTTSAKSAIFQDFDLGYNWLEGGAIEKQLTSSSAWSESSLYQMVRVNYKYNNKYLFTGTIRRDGFSGFGVDSKIGLFPSFAVAWIASEERFVDNADWLNYLKFRASYGSNGSRGLDRYETLAKVNQGYYYVFGDGGNPEMGKYVYAMSNNILGWETTTGFNTGIDFSILNQRISGNVEYYNTNSFDLIYPIMLPQISGFNTINKNIGKIHNYGIEFTIRTINVKTEDFVWNSTFNIASNKNKVVSVLGYDNDGDGSEDDLTSDGFFIGEPINPVYNYEVIGMWQLKDEEDGVIPIGYYPGTKKIRDLDGPEGGPDGVISSQYDRKILGYRQPAYRFGFMNEFKYKDFTLRAFINSIQGGKNGYYGENNPDPGAGSWSQENLRAWNIVEEWDYWTPSNPNAEYKGLYQIAAINPGHYVQRSFVRLQDVSLSYNVNTKFISKYKISNLKVYISGKNLATWTKWKGWDPETGKGITPNALPVIRSWTLGLEISF